MFIVLCSVFISHERSHFKLDLDFRLRKKLQNSTKNFLLSLTWLPLKLSLYITTV